MVSLQGINLCLVTLSFPRYRSENGLSLFVTERFEQVTQSCYGFLPLDALPLSRKLAEAQPFFYGPVAQKQTTRTKLLGEIKLL